MSAFEDDLFHAQRVLDHHGGDLSKAITRAGFRLPMVSAIAGPWPNLIANFADRARERMEADRG